MTKLLINTATEQKEIALWVDSLVHVATWSQERDLAMLLPELERLLREANSDLAELEVIYVLTGPGSFTSLRVGISTANTLAQELGLPLFGLATADYLQIRLGRKLDAALLKAGGDQVHIFIDGKFVKQAPLVELDFSDWPVLAGDLTERLKISAPNGILMEADWQPLEDCWSELEKNAVELKWPVEPQYFKEPGIT